MPKTLPSRRDLLLMAAALPLPTLATQEAPTYNFSPVNQYGINVTAAYWNPIIAHVSERSGVKLQLKLGRTSADTTAYVLANEVDFIFSNHMFSPEREQLGWKTFGRRQTPPVHGQLIVPEDSGITDLAQLAGKDVVFPGPEATVAYKFTYAQLLSRKIDVKTVFAGNMDGAFAQLLAGRAVAMGANSHMVDGYTKREGKRFKVLWSSSPVHDLALMHSARVPARDAAAVARAFVGMAADPTGRDILTKASQLAGLPADAHFIASNGTEYSVYRDFYRSAPPQLR